MSLKWDSALDPDPDADKEPVLFQIHVMRPEDDEEFVSVFADPSDTIMHLRWRIGTKSGLTYCTLRFNGVLLKDHITVREAGLTHHCRITATHVEATTLLSGCADGSVKIWSPDHGKCLETFWGHTDQVLSVAFSPSGHILVTASADKTLKLWDPESGQTFDTLTGHEDWVTHVDFSVDDETIVSTSMALICTRWIAAPSFGTPRMLPVSGRCRAALARWRVLRSLQTARM